VVGIGGRGGGGKKKLISNCIIFFSENVDVIVKTTLQNTLKKRRCGQNLLRNAWIRKKLLSL